MDGTVRPRSRRRKTRSARIATPRVMIRARGRAAPPAVLRRRRRGAELRARGRPAAHGRVAAEPGDPPARGASSASSCSCARRATSSSPRRDGGCSPTASRRCRPSTRRSPTRRGRGGACSARCGSAARPAARHEIRPALLARLRDAHPGIAVDASRGDDRQPLPRAAQPPARRRARLLHRAGAGARAPRRCCEERDARADASRASLRGAAELSLDALRERRFVIPGGGAQRRLQPAAAAAVREHGFEPRPSSPRHLGRRRVAARRRRRHARDRRAVATPRAGAHARAPLGPRAAHADRARLARGRRLARAARRFLEVATPAPEAGSCDRERRQQQLQQRADRERVDDGAEARPCRRARSRREHAELDAGADQPTDAAGAGARGRSSGRRAGRGRGRRRCRPRRRRALRHDARGEQRELRAEQPCTSRDQRRASTSTAMPMTNTLLTVPMPGLLAQRDPGQQHERAGDDHDRAEREAGRCRRRPGGTRPTGRGPSPARICSAMLTP